MRSGFCVALAATLVGLCGCSASSGASSGGSPDAASSTSIAAGLDVPTDKGVVHGKTAAGVRSFLGIPFAGSTAGSNRWKPPQPVTPWSGKRGATAFGPICPQINPSSIPGRLDGLLLPAGRRRTGSLRPAIEPASARRSTARSSLTSSAPRTCSEAFHRRTMRSPRRSRGTGRASPRRGTPTEAPRSPGPRTRWRPTRTSPSTRRSPPRRVSRRTGATSGTRSRFSLCRESLPASRLSQVENTE